MACFVHILMSNRRIGLVNQLFRSVEALQRLQLRGEIMRTDLKSRDSATCFPCTCRNHRDHTAPALYRGFCDQPDMAATGSSRLPPPRKRGPVPVNFAARNFRTGVDVAKLVKQARLQIDRDPSWLREAGPVQRKPSCPRQGTFQLQTFIGGLAHHFNNLFMVVQGNLSLLRIPGAGAQRHRRRFRRMETLIHCESMLTNDLLGPTVDPRYRCNRTLQNRILGEVILIAEQVRPTGKKLCVFPFPLDADFIGTFLPRLAGGVAAILDQITAELSDHCSEILADSARKSNHLARLQAMTAELKRAARWSAMLREYAGAGCAPPASNEDLHPAELALDVWTRADRRVPLNLCCEKTLPPVVAGRATLGRVLEELFDNAESHCPGDSAVTVELRGQADGLDITVSDPGPGIAERVRPFVCLPFFSTRRTAGHSGLGLASVAGILRSVGGNISIDPDTGRGAAVRCWLPSKRPVPCMPPAGTAPENLCA